MGGGVQEMRNCVMTVVSSLGRISIHTLLNYGEISFHFAFISYSEEKILLFL